MPALPFQSAQYPPDHPDPPDREPDLLAESHQFYHWWRHTLADTFARISEEPTYPWVAMGDFLDDWRRSAPTDRPALVAEPLPAEAAATWTPELRQWAAFCAALAEWLCDRDELPIPTWTQRTVFFLPTPWYVYPGQHQRLRQWQREQTPALFRRHNVYGDEAMLSRI